MTWAPSFSSSGELALRERTMTSCFFVSRMASTMCLPSPPVPPGTATLTIVTRVVGLAGW